MPCINGLMLGFQCLPRGPADINALKTMFDPYIEDFCFIIHYRTGCYDKKHRMSQLIQLTNTVEDTSLIQFTKAYGLILNLFLFYISFCFVSVVSLPSSPYLNNPDLKTLQNIEVKI